MVDTGCWRHPKVFLKSWLKPSGAPGEGSVGEESPVPSCWSESLKDARRLPRHRTETWPYSLLNVQNDAWHAVGDYYMHTTWIHKYLEKKTRTQQKHSCLVIKHSLSFSLFFFSSFHNAHGLLLLKCGKWPKLLEEIEFRPQPGHLLAEEPWASFFLCLWFPIYNKNKPSLWVCGEHYMDITPVDRSRPGLDSSLSR